MFKDARGQGVYNVFPGIENGQINVSITYPGVVRAFHRHWFQEDNWHIVSGQFEVVLAYEHPRVFVENREVTEPTDIQILYLGPGESVNIPRLVWHGFRILGTEPGILLYYVTNKFDPDKPDEERAPWDKFHDWKTIFK